MTKCGHKGTVSHLSGVKNSRHTAAKQSPPESNENMDASVSFGFTLIQKIQKEGKCTGDK